MTGLLFILFVCVFIYLVVMDKRMRRLENIIEAKKSTSQNESIIDEAKLKADKDAIAIQTAPQTIQATMNVENITQSPDAGKSIDDALKTKEEGKQKTSSDFEFRFGGKIFTWIGTVAVILAVGFFLRYAFENNLIGETARVIMGFAAGLLLLGVGEYTHRKYKAYGNVLAGGGIAILYLAAYASFGFYQIASQTVAFFEMSVITIGGVMLSVRYNSMPLAIFAQIGGFLTPLILSTGESRPNVLFGYIAFLNLAILAIANWKLWRPLVFINFFGTLLIFSAWFIGFSDQNIFVAQLWASVFFLINLVVLFLHHYRQKAEQNTADLALLMINSLFIFFITLDIFDKTTYSGIMIFLLGVAHILLSFLVRDANISSNRLRQFFLGIALILITVSIPIQFHKHWIAIGWAAEAFVLACLGFYMNSKKLRMFSDILFGLMLAKLLIFDSQVSPDAIPLFNERMMSFVIAIFFLVATTILHRRYKDLVSAEEKGIEAFLFFMISVVFIVGGSLEIHSFFSEWLWPVFWSFSFFSMFFFAFLMRNFAGRILAYVVSGSTMIFILSSYVDTGISMEPWLNERMIVFLATGGACIFSLTLFRKIFPDTSSDKEKTFSEIYFTSAIYFLIIFLATKEIVDFYRVGWLPIIWSLIALGGGVVGIMRKNVTLRILASATFCVVFLRLIFFDAHVDILNHIPIFNFRVMAFSVAILSIFAYVYFMLARRKPALESDIDIKNDEYKAVMISAFYAVNALLLSIFSLEIVDYVNLKFSRLSLEIQNSKLQSYENIKNVSLSSAWTLYLIFLLILGIIRKSAMVRITSIVLIMAVIAKVFLLDTTQLSDLYRFISYIFLGLILLCIGYLYNRYKERIQGFIKAN